jgi:MFS family permease
MVRFFSTGCWPRSSPPILTGLNPTTSFIMALLVFAAGFIVRPFGALVFGKIGDTFGRRYTSSSRWW